MLRLELSVDTGVDSFSALVMLQSSVTPVQELPSCDWTSPRKAKKNAPEKENRKTAKIVPNCIISRINIWNKIWMYAPVDLHLGIDTTIQLWVDTITAMYAHTYIVRVTATGDACYPWYNHALTWRLLHTWRPLVHWRHSLMMQTATEHSIQQHETE